MEHTFVAPDGQRFNSRVKAVRYAAADCFEDSGDEEAEAEADTWVYESCKSVSGQWLARAPHDPAAAEAGGAAAAGAAAAAVTVPPPAPA